jgi:hypothetical protein
VPKSKSYSTPTGVMGADAKELLKEGGGNPVNEFEKLR